MPRSLPQPSPIGVSPPRTQQKIKKTTSGAPSFALTENPDILATVAKLKTGRPPLVVGFAAETEKVIEHAKAKLKRKGCDWIVANDVSPASGVMGGDRNAVHLVSAQGVESWPSQSKDEVARESGRAHRHNAERNSPVTDVDLQIVQLPHGAGLPLPAYQTAAAAGLDLIAAVPDGQPVTIAPGAYAMIPTGIALALPPGTEGQVRPRSGLAAKHGITVLNSPGTIDSDYRGEVSVILINHGKTPFAVERGMRIAQLVIAMVASVSVRVVEKLVETERGSGGFGSTGTKSVD